MPLRTFHPCSFGFRTSNIHRVASVVDGGTSLSGYKDEVESDGGGFYRAEFTAGSTRTREQGNAWRAVTDFLGGGGVKINVLLCAERLFQPVNGVKRPHRDGAVFGDGSDYTNPGAAYTASVAALRATTITIAGISELPLIGGELFSIQHPTWGWRVYRINAVEGSTISFLPPLREAITNGTPLEFDNPRCQMKLAQASDNSTDLGRFTNCSAIFVEDMSQPA